MRRTMRDMDVDPCSDITPQSLYRDFYSPVGHHHDSTAVFKPFFYDNVSRATRWAAD